MSRNVDYRRIDPIFKLQTPLLFAHRGGVLEVSESTKKAFKYAKDEAGADILELDVQLTNDGQFVVWHGPSLDNVYIEGEDPEPSLRQVDRRMIYDFDWQELEGKAWVIDPGEQNLSDVPKEDDRHLLLLSEFLEEFPKEPLNIEMKGSFKKKLEGNKGGLVHNVSEFLKILNDGRGDRIIVVVSAKHSILKEFRIQSKGEYPTNLSLIEQILLRFSNKELKNRALETSYYRCLSSQRIVEKVRRLGGSTFVFLTAFWPIPSIDKDPRREDIFNILDRGVDGIMTDRPKQVRKLMDKWIKQTMG